MLLREGQELAGYRIVRKIGEGGMGQVYLAEQLRLGRQVALKVVWLDVKPETPQNVGAAPADELTREAQALMALEHPHILPLYDTGRDEDMAYLVMPYIPDGSLQDALRAGPRQRLQLPLAPAEALAYLEQAAAALQYAHDRNFVHRDVKPANFLVRSLTRSISPGQTSSRLHLFLADFGLSKFLAYSSTNTAHISGTPTYMAPEQFQGRASPASDQYSLAVLFFYLLTGQLPFRGSPVELMFRHMNDQPPSVREMVPGLPESLVQVIRRGMAKTPAERFPSVMAFAEAARSALGEAGLAVSPDSLPATPAVRLSKFPEERQGSLSEQKQTGMPPSSLPTVQAGPLSAPGAAYAEANVWQKSANNQAGVPVQVSVVKEADNSLPTMPVEVPVRPHRPESSAEKPPRRRGRLIAFGMLAVLLVGGAAFAGGLLLQQRNTSNAPVVQATSTPTSVPTLAPTFTATLAPTATTVPTTPTAVPAANILSSILAQQPTVTVDLNAGSGQWGGPNQLNPNAAYHLFTPGGAVDILNASITLLDTSVNPSTPKAFQTPLAVAVDLQAGGDQEFDILLDATDGSTHQIYRLKLGNAAPPEVDLSTDNKTFVAGAKGSTVNTTWADNGKHTLILVLDGTRLLFYVDQQPFLDAQVPLTQSSASLTLESLDRALVTGIRVYAVPQA